MTCEQCGDIPTSDPAGLFGDVITVAAKGAKGAFGGITGIFKKAPSVIQKTGGSYGSGSGLVGGAAKTTSGSLSGLGSGVSHGTVLPSLKFVQQFTRATEPGLTNTIKSSTQAAIDRIAAISVSARPVIKTPVSTLDDVARFSDNLKSIIDEPIRVYEKGILTAPRSLRSPVAAAELQGAARASKSVVDDILRVAKTENRGFTAVELDSLTAARKVFDDADVIFRQADAFEPAAILRQADAFGEIKLTDDAVSQVARMLDDVGVGATDDAARAGAGMVDDTLRVAADGVDDAARVAAGGADDALRVGTQTTGSGVGGIFGAADRIAGATSGVYKAAALLGGGAVVGGLGVKLLTGEASAIPIGDDLEAYTNAVCDPNSPYFDEASCATMTQVNELLDRYPNTWEDVCIEGSPIYDRDTCVAIQGMVAAAKAGVPYQGGTPEDYGGTTQVIDQAMIDQYVSLYCHPASPYYNADTCEQVKALAAKYGLSVTEPGGSSGGGGGGDLGGSEPGYGVEEPPWDELSIEEIQAILCDKYGNWYDAELCRQYTEYLKEQQGVVPSSGGSGGGTYVEGSEEYPMAGTDADGGWYGGSGGGVQYVEVSDTPICAIEDPVCIGWFQYGTEWFYWDGQEFYDAYGNMVYFIWTDEDQAAYESALATMYPDGGLNVSGDVAVAGAL